MYNKNFELDLDDMELIERALRTLPSTCEQTDPKDVNELLGRLHNQKVFYRPKNATYVGG